MLILVSRLPGAPGSAGASAWHRLLGAFAPSPLVFVARTRGSSARALKPLASRPRSVAPGTLRGWNMAKKTRKQKQRPATRRPSGAAPARPVAGPATAQLSTGATRAVATAVD